MISPIVNLARRAPAYKLALRRSMSSSVATSPNFSMKEKVCVVTGAARGLGEEFCRAFVHSGCTELAMLDLKQSEAKDSAANMAKYAKELLRKDDISVIGVECDVSSEESVQKAFKQVISSFGKVDAVVASAGIVENYPSIDYPADRVRRLYDINVHGAFFTAREAAKDMIPRGEGSIVLISSMSANVVNIPQLQTPYNASKAAVKHMASSLALEWAKTGVRVNSLAPGYMVTKLTREILAKNPELEETWTTLTPMGRLGVPNDLSGAIVFLCSDASKFMTGSELRVDGGYCLA